MRAATAWRGSGDHVFSSSPFRFCSVFLSSLKRSDMIPGRPTGFAVTESGGVERLSEVPVFPADPSPPPPASPPPSDPSPARASGSGRVQIISPFLSSMSFNADRISRRRSLFLPRPFGLWKDGRKKKVAEAGCPPIAGLFHPFRLRAYVRAFTRQTKLSQTISGFATMRQKRV